MPFNVISNSFVYGNDKRVGKNVDMVDFFDGTLFTNRSVKSWSLLSTERF